MNLPKNKLTNEKIDEILIPMLFGEEGMAKQDGSSLMGQIVYSQNSKLSKSREKIESLIHQAEIRAELRGVENTMDAWNDNGNGGLLQWASDEYNRLSALEKEIVC